MNRDRVPPGMHPAIPTKDNDTLHEGLDAHGCAECIRTATAMVRAKAPEAGGHRIQLGSTVRVREESRFSREPGVVAITEIRLNTYNGEIWLHAFALGGNRVLTADDIEEVIPSAPGTSGRPETDPAPELTAMTGRLASVLRTLGDICDAPGMTRRPPDELARWLRYGDEPGQDERN